LHDAVEDQGGPTTLKTIRKLFGDRVADTVRECSDSESDDPGSKKPWQERKRTYLDHLVDASADAVLVSIADKLHNARAVLNDYRNIGDELWKRFNKEASKKDQLDYHRALVTAFRSTTAPPNMVKDLDRTVTELEHLANSREPQATELA
jgi:hypothetical protein